MADPPPDAHAAMHEALVRALDDRYDVRHELARGGMASIWQAWDRRHGRDVAIKVVGAANGASAERFLREIRTTARLTHPHVLTLFDSGDAAGLLYYVMPYVEGETLRARLERGGALPLAEATRFLREIADALAYAHGRGVVHRDLKPENVLLSGDHAVVMDFGIAKALAVGTQAEDAPAGLTTAGMVIGTPGYMAPEQVLGDPDVDYRADLYALGVIAYEMLTGAHPFADLPRHALARAGVTETPPRVEARRSDVPPEVASLVTSLLARDRDARPVSAATVLRALDDSSATARGARMPARRRPLAVLAIVAALAALVAGVLTWRRLAPPAELSRSLAVLPFQNVGGNLDDEYFSDGMTDELAHALARIPGVRIAGRTSSFAYKGRAVAAEDVGRTLDVGVIVVGSVRRAGERLRVATQLVSTRDGKVLWDSIFESPSGDVFAVQDSLTRAMVAALAPALSGTPLASPLPTDDRGTADQEAYDLYLKGRYHWHERGADNVRQSIAYFEQAIARDSSFARAWAGLALSYAVLPIYVPGTVDSAAVHVGAAAERAMALDPELPDALVAAGIRSEYVLRLDEAERRYRLALDRDPSYVNARHVLGMLLLTLGRPQEAVSALRQATQIDPLAKSAGTSTAMALIADRRFDEGAVEARRILAIDSTFALAWLELATAQLFGGAPDSAVLGLEHAMRLHPEAPYLRSTLVLAYAAAGRWDDAERLREALRAPSGDATRPLEAAYADFVLGDPAPTLDIISDRDGLRRWTNYYVGFGCNPLFDPMWKVPRFVRIMAGIGVAPCPLARDWPFPTTR